MERCHSTLAALHRLLLMIRIPYIPGMLNPNTEAWGLAHGAEFVAHEDREGMGYFDLLCDWWQNTEGDLLIVEQDKVPPEGAIEEMAACDFDWCSCSYPIAGNISHGWGTGCVKFSASLREKYPEMMELAGVPGEEDPEPPRVYWVVDIRLGCLLAKEGYLPHSHGECRHAHVLTDRERMWIGEQPKEECSVG